MRIEGGRRREIGCWLFAGSPAGLAVSAREDRCRLVVENLRSSVSFVGSDFATEATEHTEKEDTLCAASRNHEGREEHEGQGVRGQERRRALVAFFSCLFRSFVSFVHFVVSPLWLRPEAPLHCKGVASCFLSNHFDVETTKDAKSTKDRTLEGRNEGGHSSRSSLAFFAASCLSCTSWFRPFGCGRRPHSVTLRPLR